MVVCRHCGFRQEPKEIWIFKIFGYRITQCENCNKFFKYKIKEKYES